MSEKKLQRAIDTMVENAIRRILPAVMNEVLLKAVAGSGITESAPAPAPRPAQRKQPPVQQRPQPKRAQQRSRLSDVLHEDVGADFYGVAEDEPAYEAPRPSSMQERIQTLAPHLQALAEDVTLDDMDEVQVDEDDAPAGPPLGRVAAAGFDFGAMNEILNRTGAKKSVTEAQDKQKFEEARLERQRALLNSQVVG